ncbi:MAG: VapE domain-containing protein [Gordonibacter pamelaeae]
MEGDAIYAVGETLPWRRLPRGCSLWGDSDDANLRIYLETRYGIVNKAEVDDAVSHFADAAPYDPWASTWPRCPWDGVPRAEALLVNLSGAEDCAYVRAVTRKTLCGAVRRALHPGCKFDYMLILEGAQGLGKSSLLAALAGEWFADALSLEDIAHAKVAAEKLQGAWIVEVAELDGMAKASIERLKSFLTTSVDNYRAAYARRAGRYRRRCVIVGTVNNLDGYLRDATGNRRFWPVRVARGLDRSALDGAYVAQVWPRRSPSRPPASRCTWTAAWRTRRAGASARLWRPTRGRASCRPTWTRPCRRASRRGRWSAGRRTGRPARTWGGLRRRRGARGAMRGVGDGGVARGAAAAEGTPDARRQLPDSRHPPQARMGTNGRNQDADGLWEGEDLQEEP